MQTSPTPTLSPQERDLLYLLVHGHTSQQAATLLGMEPDEAGTVLEALQARVGIGPRHSHTKMIVRAMILGWV